MQKDEALQHSLSSGSAPVKGKATACINAKVHQHSRSCASADASASWYSSARVTRTHASRCGSALLLCTAQNAMLLPVSLFATHAMPALQRLQTPARIRTSCFMPFVIYLLCQHSAAAALTIVQHKSWHQCQSPRCRTHVRTGSWQLCERDSKKGSLPQHCLCASISASRASTLSEPARNCPKCNGGRADKMFEMQGDQL